MERRSDSILICVRIDRCWNRYWRCLSLLGFLILSSALFVVGCLSVANSQNPFCYGELCFIRPDPNSGKSWWDAQQTCKDNTATLPIAAGANSRMSFNAALSHFNLIGMDVWLGANASDNGFDNWSWLDGSQYSGPEVRNRGDYSKSYAYVAKKESEVGLLAYASPPSDKYAYICQCNVANTGICTNGTGRTAFVKENQCFTKNDESVSWFNARNKCLENSCDLASFSQLSLLDGMVDSSSSGFWVGLRTSQWNWQDAMTGLSSFVTITTWSIGQPDEGAPHCMATNSGDFPNWKDANCSYTFPYICQDKRPPGTPPNPSTTIPTTTTSFRSNPTPTITTISLLGTPGTESSSASLSTPLSSSITEMSGLSSNNENSRNSTNAGSVNVPLAKLDLVLASGLSLSSLSSLSSFIRKKHRNRQLGRDGAIIEPEIANSKQISASSPNPVLPRVESDANDHYQQLKNNNELQEQQQYEELQEAPQYEQLQRRNELQEQQQYEQLPQAPQYEQL